MTNEISFEELLKSAKETADKRKKVFNELDSYMRNFLVPRFCQVMRDFGIEKKFFLLSEQPLPHMDTEHDEFGNEEFFVCLRDDGYIIPAFFNLTSEKYQIYCNSVWVSIKEADFYKSCLIEFCSTLKFNISKMIKKHQLEIENANKILKS